jgi:hypothetical protein
MEPEGSSPSSQELSTSKNKIKFHTLKYTEATVMHSSLGEDHHCCGEAPTRGCVPRPGINGKKHRMANSEAARYAA